MKFFLPANHPVLKELMKELEDLRTRCQELEISRAMYVREAERLADAVKKETKDEIQKLLWGKPRHVKKKG
jgi:hypothetical protein